MTRTNFSASLDLESHASRQREPFPFTISCPKHPGKTSTQHYLENLKTVAAPPTCLEIEKILSMRRQCFPQYFDLHVFIFPTDIEAKPVLLKIKVFVNLHPPRRLAGPISGPTCLRIKLVLHLSLWEDLSMDEAPPFPLSRPASAPPF